MCVIMGGTRVTRPIVVSGVTLCRATDTMLYVAMPIPNEATVAVGGAIVPTVEILVLTQTHCHNRSHDDVTIKQG